MKIMPCLLRDSQMIYSHSQKSSLIITSLWIDFFDPHGTWKNYRLPAVKHEIMEKESCAFSLDPRNMKKMTNCSDKTNPRKYTRIKFTFYLFRRGGQPKLLDSILSIKTFFGIRLEWLKSNVNIYSEGYI